MAHWAELDDDNVVLRVIVCDEDGGGADVQPAWITENLGGRWQRTYYDTPPNRYAGTGMIWREDLGAFLRPQPYPSWSLDDDLEWQAPVPMPEGDLIGYTWDEALGTWIPART